MSATYFNPRSPHGERRALRLALLLLRKDFNPRSPHGERLVHVVDFSLDIGISIHAPRTGSDGAGVMRPRAR